MTRQIGSEKVILTNGFYGFGVVDVSDPSNIKELDKYINTSYPCGFEKCDITLDSLTIICACREVGILIFDFNHNKLS